MFYLNESFMRTISISGIILCILFFTTIYACSKSPDNIDTSITITLHDKPLTTIQSYVQGDWKLRYISGGFCGTCRSPLDQYYRLWTFGPDNHIKQTNNNVISVDTTISWNRFRDVFGDTTYLLNFYDKTGYWNSYIVDKIYKDTLLLFDNSTDPSTYHFTKVK